MSTSASINIHYASIVAQVPDLVSYARARGESANAAEKMVEESLVRAITRANSFRSEEEIRAWLFMTLHNLCVKKRKPEASAAPLMLPEASVRDRIYNRLLRRALNRAAMTLSKHQRRDLALLEAEIALHEARRPEENREIWHHRHSATLH